MRCFEPLNGSPCESASTKMQDPWAASVVSTTKNIIARTLENAPPNDDVLHGRAARTASCATCARATAKQSIDWHGHIGTPVTWYYCTEHLDCIDGSHYLRGRC